MTVENSLFGAIKLIKNVVFDKWKYFGYGIKFDSCGTYLVSHGSGFGKNVIIFCADMSSFKHVDNRNKDKNKGPT